MKEFVQKHTGELVALLLLIPLALILGRLLWVNPAQPLPSPAVSVVTTPTTTPVASILSGTPVAEPSHTATTTPVVATVTWQIKAPSGTSGFSQPFPHEQLTVADALKAAVEAGHISAQTKDYGGSLGLFVEEINGVKNNPRTSFYWNLYINGKHSPVGASTATVRAEDVITWSYEKEHTE